MKKRKGGQKFSAYKRIIAADELVTRKPLIQQINDRWYLLAPDGTKEGAGFATREEAENAALKKAMESVGVREVIEERGGKFCILSADRSKQLGCYDSKAAAAKRLGQIEYFKQRGGVTTEAAVAILDSTLSLSEIKSVCPKCAGILEARRWKNIKVSALLEQAQDPDAVCGALWFRGTPEQRDSFAGGTQGRGTSEKPPKEWWDDCLSKIQASVKEQGEVRTSPDEEDGHIHAVAELNENGDGLTAESSGDKSAPHKHEIVGGEVQPFEGDNFTSEHPGSLVSGAAPAAAPAAPPAGEATEGRQLQPFLRQSESRFSEAGPQDPEGRDWKAVLLEEGMSLNGRLYTREVLRDIFERKIFEGLPAFAFVYRTEDGLILDHARDGIDTTKFPKDVAGFHQEVALEETSPGKMGLVSRFRFVDDTLRKKALEAWNGGNHKLFGFSIDAIGEGEELSRDNIEVKYIVRANSDDLVTHPAAGGRFVRMVASIGKGGDSKPLKEDGAMNEREMLLQLITEVAPKLLEGKDTAKLTLDELKGMIKGKEFEAIRKAFADIAGQGQAAPAAPTQPAPAAPVATPAAAAAVDQGALVNEAVKKAMAPYREAAHKNAVEAAIKEAKLDGHKEAADLIRDLAAKSPGDEAHLKACVGRAQKLLEASGWQDPQLGNVTVGEEPRDRHVRAIEGAMAGRPQKGTPPFRSLKHMVESMTGLRDLSSSDYLSIANALMGGVIAGWKDFRRGDGKKTLTEAHERRMHESGRVRFAARETINLAQLNTIFGDSVTRKMIADYNMPQLNDWRAICSKIGFVEDTRVQRRERLGYYGGLATVAESGPYLAITSLTDEEVTIEVTKKGNFELITEEAILRNDLGWFAKVPQRLNLAGLQEIRQTVWNLLHLNGAIYDGSTLFHIANHANRAAATLSVTNLATARASMRKQRAYGAATPLTRNRLGAGNVPKFLIVPPELENTANQITSSQFEPTSQLFQVANLNKGLSVIVLDFETDVDRFYLVADPSNTPTIEADFIGNTDVPELWTQDDPTVGSPFDSDEIKVKVRTWMGAAVIDYRGMYAGIP